MKVQEQLRIGFVYDGVYDPTSGVSSYIDSLSSYLREQEHTVTILAAESRIDKDYVRALGRTIMVNLNGSQLGIPLPLAEKRAREITTELALDVAHLQGPEMPWFGVRLASSVRAANPEAALVATSHSLPGTPMGSLVGYALGKASQAGVYRHSDFDHIFSVSEPARNYVRDKFKLESTVLPCPVDITRFQTGKRLEGYGRDKTNIVFLGRLVERKGCDRLLDAISLLPVDMLSNTRVLIGGGGPQRAELEKQARGLGLANTVEFFGRIEEKDKPNFLATADIAVFPSLYGESFGIVLVEAMASGAGVVIAGNNIGYSETLSPTPDALIDPKHKKAFSQKFRDLVGDADYRSTLLASQQVTVGQYDVSVIGPKIEAEYNAILTKRRKAE